ncbi:unnamed protein product [Cunninghamella blakesleeana]
MILPKEEIQLPSTFINCTPNEYLEALYSFLEKYRWLADLHVGDFITLNHWELLYPEWRKALLPDSFESEKEYNDWFISILNLTSYPDIKEDWPTSLKEYLKLVRELPLPRQKTTVLDDQSKVNKNTLAGGMSDKKIHEVELLAKLIKVIGDQNDISSVLDLGSGQGYLSRTLAFKHGMKVLGVDMSEIQTKGAEKFDQKALKAISSSKNESIDNNNNSNDNDKNNINQGFLKHVTEMVTPENVGSVLSRWGYHNDDNDEQQQQNKVPWIVCGLHTCGDLATSMFRLFASSDQIKSVVNVGCCYHFLSEDGHQPGFPMSEWLKQKDYKLGNSARVLACQSPSKWTDPVIGQQSFNQYFYRAVLLHSIVSKKITEKAPPIGMIKRKKTFLQYYQASMKRLNYTNDLLSEEEAEGFHLYYKHKQIDKQIIVLWTLRVLLGPVLESLILVDRWVYLKSIVNKEKIQRKVWMWPLFDPIASPRNMVFVVSK